jgi:hypothetical protein
LTLSASCSDCFLTGTGTATTQGFSQNGTILDDVIKATEELIKDPEGFIAEALDMNVVVDLENLSGHFQFDINFGAGGSISVPLIHPITPLGGEVCHTTTI